MYWLYSLSFTVGFFLAIPYFLFQALVYNKYLSSFGQRLGFLPADLIPSAQGSIWIHAVSVGEVLSVQALIQEIHKEWPMHPLYLSTTTVSGQNLANEKLSGLAKVFYFPFDWAFSVRRTFDKIRPGIVLIAETEIWPNFLREGRRRNIPVMLINGRISDHSFSRYRRIHWLLKQVLAHFSYCCMQSQEDLERLVSLGASRTVTEVCGNLKYDLNSSLGVEEQAKKYRRMFGLHDTDFLVIAGSTMKDEEGLVLSAFEGLKKRCPRSVLLLAPRHPERFKEVEQLLRQRSFQFVKRSELNADRQTDSLQKAAVLLLDSMGELAALYALADVVFIGGSLVATGGHNPLEPALFKKPVLFGPHMSNFRETAELFVRRKAALVIHSVETLAEMLLELSQDPLVRREIGENAYQILEENRGASSRIVTRMQRLLETRKRVPAAQ